MKKKLIALFSIFAVILVGVYALNRRSSRNQVQNDGELQVVTSFYPMYILTKNLTKDASGVTVVNLTENQTGCLHDYQLTTQDMIILSSADLFVMNGGGMEGFVQNVIEAYPNLETVEASAKIKMLASTSEHHHDHGDEEHEDETHEEAEHDEHLEEEHNDGTTEHDEEEEHNHGAADHEEEMHELENEHKHDHGEWNAHVWMNLENYLIEMKNVYQALITKDPENETIYTRNYVNYREEVEALKVEYENELQGIVNREVIIFHDAFAYMANQLGLEVVKAVNLDSDTYLSAGEVKEIIDEVKSHDIKVLFTEEQYSDSVASSVAKETNANVYVVDSLVTGKDDLNAYIEGMRNNLEVLKKALY